jgi:hypothetical protein
MRGGDGLDAGSARSHRRPATPALGSPLHGRGQASREPTTASLRTHQRDQVQGVGDSRPPLSPQAPPAVLLIRRERRRGGGAGQGSVGFERHERPRGTSSIARDRGAAAEGERRGDLAVPQEAQTVRSHVGRDRCISGRTETSARGRGADEGALRRASGPSHHPAPRLVGAAAAAVAAGDRAAGPPSRAGWRSPVRLAARSSRRALPAHVRLGLPSESGPCISGSAPPSAGRESGDGCPEGRARTPRSSLLSRSLD